MSSSCALCQIVQNGFKKECARKDTSSYRCWGNATYFSNQTFVCQTYNGASQIDNRTNQRCTIMAKINRGYTVRGKKLIDIWQSAVPLAMLIARMNYDTVTVSRDYYIAPAEYLLLYNEFAAIPTYIVVYSFQTKSLQVRKGTDDYCKFHNEHHGCSAGCDGHYSYAYASCLGDGTPGRSFNLYNGIPERDPYKLNDGTDLAGVEANILSTMRQLNMSENCS